jgi:hypothetical protein
LLPKTGLPKESGYFFDHIMVMNSLHDLNMELNAIKNFHNHIWDYIGVLQDYAGEMTSYL